MASIKPKFRPSSIEGKKGVIFFQIIQNRMIRQLKTDYHIFPFQWDDQKSVLNIPHPDLQKELVEIQNNIDWDIKRLEAVNDIFELKGEEYSSDDIIDFFNKHKEELSLFDFLKQQIKAMHDSGRIRTSETYTTTLYSISRFLNHKDILLKEITADLLRGYERNLQENGVTKNSTSFYLRILRAVYNRAVNNEIVEQTFPFKNVYTGVDATVKHALNMEFVRRIKNYDYSDKPDLAFARDMFLFSFYTRGMSFIDMAYLRKDALQGSTLLYRRRKNGQLLHLRWEPCMAELAEKYASDEDSPYMLRILSGTNPETNRNQYKNALYQLNKVLKVVGLDNKVPFPLTMYVARHSWASIAHKRKTDLSVIAEGLGHESEERTDLYLSSLDTTLVDQANASMLNDL